MKKILKAVLRYLAQLAASEGGEFLSVRRKAHLLEAQRYFRIAAEGEKERARPSH
jgi:hypothetical protein